ncbi:PucR family transcriptional regulator [Rhodococcus sp. UNC23MFCrub1.1]|uniref:PucR family transcriptional regulator n=1 Tax=Rhodococcus sp. UNC23MFCrub1.1 TaxID=1449068 RepID=UPI0004859F7A|nr:PucR family transcriptional regulator [Rhodococcus sp. UNC23MFCrub1.1]
MKVHDLLDMPHLGLDPLVSDDGRDTVIRWVVTTDMLDPGRYLEGGELVLTGLMWHTRPEDSDVFVRAITGAGVAALAASYDGVVPADLVESCRRHGLPLFRVSAAVAFATITESVVRSLSRERATDLRSVLDRHRRLVSGAGAGDGIGPLLDLVSEDLGLECWVLTPGGRVVASSHPLPDDIRPDDLAHDFLTARALPVVSHGLSLLAVDGDRTSRVADAMVAFRSDWRSWTPERLALAEDVASIVALERERTDDRLGSSGRSAHQLIRVITAGGSVADTLAQMTVVGLDTDAWYAVVAAAVASGPLRPGELRVVLRELLPSGGAIGVTDGEVVAIVPTDDDLTPRVRSGMDRLGPGLAGSDVSLGVSGAVTAGELRGAVDEARYARRLAAGRSDGVRIVGHDELADLVLLLASVPDEMRRLFRSRLLDPVVEYDDRHQSDLVPTLRAFLDCNGSWTACSTRLHLHVNSVRYRIQRIEELTGRDLSGLEDRVNFYLALRMS